VLKVTEMKWTETKAELVLFEFVSF